MSPTQPAMFKAKPVGGVFMLRWHLLSQSRVQCGGCTVSEVLLIYFIKSDKASLGTLAC